MLTRPNIHYRSPMFCLLETKRNVEKRYYHIEQNFSIKTRFYTENWPYNHKVLNTDNSHKHATSTASQILHVVLLCNLLYNNFNILINAWYILHNIKNNVLLFIRNSKTYLSWVQFRQVSSLLRVSLYFAYYRYCTTKNESYISLII